MSNKLKLSNEKKKVKKFIFVMNDLGIGKETVYKLKKRVFHLRRLGFSFFIIFA